MEAKPISKNRLRPLREWIITHLALKKTNLDSREGLVSEALRELGKGRKEDEAREKALLRFAPELERKH